MAPTPIEVLNSTETSFKQVSLLPWRTVTCTPKLRKNVYKYKYVQKM
jgi:hypothetical protein